MTDRDGNALLGAVLRRDPGAWPAFLEWLEDLVKSQGKIPEGDREDLVPAVLLEFLTRLRAGQLPVIDCADAYFSSALGRSSRLLLRRRAARERMQGRVRAEAELRGAGSSAEAAEWGRVVIGELLRMLPEQDRALLWRHFAQGESYGALAGQWGASASSLRRRVARLLHSLRAKQGNRSISGGAEGE